MNVTQAEFQSFVKKYEADNANLTHLITEQCRKQAEFFRGMEEKLQAIPLSCSNGRTPHPQANATFNATASPYENFMGIIPNPNTGRSPFVTSFVNVGKTIKLWVENFNQSRSQDEEKINISEMSGSILSWSHQAYSVVHTIITSQKHLNVAYGSCTLENAKHHDIFKNRRSKYSAQVAAALLEIEKQIPVVTITSGKWAARELLKNKFQSHKNMLDRKSKTSALRRSPNNEISTGNRSHRQVLTTPTIDPPTTIAPQSDSEEEPRHNEIRPSARRSGLQKTRLTSRQIEAKKGHEFVMRGKNSIAVSQRGRKRNSAPVAQQSRNIPKKVDTRRKRVTLSQENPARRQAALKRTKTFPYDPKVKGGMRRSRDRKLLDDSSGSSELPEDRRETDESSYEDEDVSPS